MSSLKAIVGLGNPGPSYADTRHNAGYQFVDLLASRAGSQFKAESKLGGFLCTVSISGQKLALFKPDVFMNLSGGPSGKLLRYYKMSAEDVLVAYDELDLEPGVARFKLAGGHGGHNGLRDLFRHIGQEFHRLRIGIGHPGDRSLVSNYVLSRPRKEESHGIERAMDVAFDVLGDYVAGDRNRAVKTLHTETAVQDS